jgi:lipoprotein signal peptidase
LHLNIVLNTGISFSQLQDNTILVYILQISLSTIVLLICILFSNKWYYTLCLTAIFTGGFFNVLQRATPVTFNFSIDGYAAGEKIHNVVVDYFEINGFAVFNFPDSFIVGGTILGAAIYFVITIIAFVNNKDYQVDKSNSINLFIDSTQKKFNICIFQNDKIVEKFSIETNNNLTDIAIEHIDKLLNKIGITSKEINNIYLTVGPGSFTGVRIGNLIAKS